MDREYFVHYSGHLGRNMSMLIYGWGGVPILAFPCQDGYCDNWEGYHMPEVLEDYINSGRIQLFVVDTVDRESFSDAGGDNGHRAWIQEMYFRYITEEAVPHVMYRNGTGIRPYAVGFSLGATHAMIVTMRRPDLFSGMLCLSGVYNTEYFFDGWSNPTLYDNSPLMFLRNMPFEHDYIGKYNELKLIVCVGQGAWEDVCIPSTIEFKQLCESKGINAWVDFWGFDSVHDWPWWYKQIRYYLPFLLERYEG